MSIKNSCQLRIHVIKGHGVIKGLGLIKGHGVIQEFTFEWLRGEHA